MRCAWLLWLTCALLALGCVRPSEPQTPSVEAASFDLVLTSAGESKILAIKLVREVTGLGLKEAKDLVDGAPRAVRQALPRAEAEALAKRFRESGLSVELRPHEKSK